MRLQKQQIGGWKTRGRRWWLRHWWPAQIRHLDRERKDWQRRCRDAEWWTKLPDGDLYQKQRIEDDGCECGMDEHYGFCWELVKVERT